MQKLALFALIAAGALAACGESASQPGTPDNQDSVQQGQPVSASAAGITLPIEVLGAAGTTREISVPLSGADVAAGGLALSLQIHNLSYDDKGSVQINGSSWIPLRNDTVTVAEPGKSYGGIGGAFHTLKLTVNLPAGAAVAGANTIRFRFNGTDGVSMGYRVLRVNVLGANGQPLVPPSSFTQDDPNTWTAPYPDAAKIAQGKDLWLNASLGNPANPGGARLRAHCTDCHAKDGRDLHYFNYSNTAIIERAKFHSLTEEQGKLIASYIRSRPPPPPGPSAYPNPDPHPGRPWNPPFQPGPGVDSRPFNEWAAGAGVDWVLDSDASMMPYLFPNGITVDRLAKNANVNAREIPIGIQLPDWNHWLPHVHPLDAWGDDFDASEVRKRYDGGGPAPKPSWNVRDYFKASYANGHPTLMTDRNYRDVVSTWNLRLSNFLGPRQLPPGDPSWTVEHGRKIYDTALWFDVKTWEFVQEFQVEGNKMWPNDRELRSMVQSNIFDTAPHILHIPATMSGIQPRPGNDAHNYLMWTYFSAAWYQTQLVLNSGNHSDGKFRNNQRPIDWGYSYGFLKDLPDASNRLTPLMTTLYWIKGMQVGDNDAGLIRAGDANEGWHPAISQGIAILMYQSWLRQFNLLTPADRTRIFDVLVQRWFDVTRSYPAEAHHQTGFATADDTLPAQPYIFGSYLEKVWLQIPAFRQQGVNGARLNAMADWAATVWPKPNWNSLKVP